METTKPNNASALKECDIMSDIMYPVSFGNLMNHIMTEYKMYNRIYNVNKNYIVLIMINAYLSLVNPLKIL